jgi:transcriptional regulator with XRE-family HTH domain
MPTVKKKHLGRNVTRIRTSIGLKQEDLADRIGISQQMISKYEQSEELDEKVLERLSEGLGVPPEFIKGYYPGTSGKVVYNNYEAEISGGQNSLFGDNPTVNAVDELIQSYKEQITNMKEIYERLVAEKDKQIEDLKKRVK